MLRHTMISGKCELSKYASRWNVHTLHDTSMHSTAILRIVNPQPQVVPIYRPRKDETLGWLERIWVNNVLKVPMHRSSGTASMWTSRLQIQKPTHQPLGHSDSQYLVTKNVEWNDNNQINNSNQCWNNTAGLLGLYIALSGEKYSVEYLKVLS